VRAFARENQKTALEATIVAHIGQAKIKARLIADLDPDEWDLPPKPKWMRWRIAISRWERAEVPIDSNAETLIRLHAIQELKLKVDASVKEISGWALPKAEETQIRIDGTNPSHYQLAA
jgi:hypothetical protein